MLRRYRRHSDRADSALFFFFKGEDGIRDSSVTGVQTCALPILFLAGSLLSRGQPVPAAESPVPARTYHLLREEDDWSFLADPANRQELWDPIKYIPLRSGRNDWFLSMGGEAREIWEQIGNDNWGQQPFMNGYFNQRYMFYLDVHYGKHVRL